MFGIIFLKSIARPEIHACLFHLPLEMGSWNWLKKNPLQIFNRHGVFNPIQPHRRSRILRRHINLFDFLHRAVLSPRGWLNQEEAVRQLNFNQAMELWYAA